MPDAVCSSRSTGLIRARSPKGLNFMFQPPVISSCARVISSCARVTLIGRSINDQPDDGYMLPRAVGHAGRSGQRDGEPAVLASWTLTTSSTTYSRAATSTSSRSWLGQLEVEQDRGSREVVREIESGQRRGSSFSEN